MPAGRVRRVQDSVHGLMEFRGMEAVVIELLRTPEFQRLRKIRQLGLAHLVFPGAEHSRLVHSLGASYLAIRFGRHLAERASDFFTAVLCPDESSIRDLAIGALCHDLGHGPLSHAFEREIVGTDFKPHDWARAFGLELPPELIGKLKWHELVAQGLLRWPRGELHKLLQEHEEGLAGRIGDLLLGKYYLPYLPRLLASDIDVDRADFIRRDTHQTGVAYGRYDLDWMISICSLGYQDAAGVREWIVGFDERKAVRVVEQFLIARRAMYDTVYHHRTVRAAEGMVALFLRRLREVVKEGVEVEVARVAMPLLEVVRGVPLEPPQLLQLDDFALTVLIDNVAQSDIRDSTLRDLALRIRSRDLFKRIPVSTDVLSRYLRTEHAREQLYEAIKPFVPGDPRYYLLHDEAQFSMLASDDAAAASLITDTGEARFLKDHTDFSHYQHEKHEVVRLFTVREAVDAAVLTIGRGKGEAI